MHKDKTSLKSFCWTRKGSFFSRQDTIKCSPTTKSEFEPTFVRSMDGVIIQKQTENLPDWSHF